MISALRLHLCLFSLFVVPILLADEKGPQSLEELNRAIETVLREGRTPGAAAAIVRGDKVEWIAGFGRADEAANKPVTTKTIFRIGSVSKVFVALAALKLQEQGKLKLTDTLRQWVPEFPVMNAWEATDPVRLDQLLEHTAGIPDFRFSEYAHNDPTPATLAQALNLAPENRVIRWRPGSRYAYSSIGIALVAAVVEKASGQRFEDYVQDQFFAPLQMTGASYFLSPQVKANLTTMYWSRSHRVAPYHHLLYRPPGAVNASIEDMANYVRFHLRRGDFEGRRILETGSMNRLETPTTLPSARAGVTVGYSLCLWSRFTSGYKWYGHWGNRDACYVGMEYCPELGVGLVMMLNSNQEWTLSRGVDLMRLYVMRNAPPKVFPAAGPMPAFMTKDFTGIYRNIAPRDEGYTDFMEGIRSFRRIRVDDTGMTMSRVPSRWVPVSGNLFRLEDGMEPELAVITGENGETLLQCFEGTFRRTSEVGLAAAVYAMKFSFAVLFSAVLFAVIWGPRFTFGRLRNAGPLGPRAWPLLGVVGIAGFAAFYHYAQEGRIEVIGTMNILSVGVMLATLLVPLSATLTAVQLWRHRRTPMNRFAYWHAVLVTLGLVIITGYGLIWGLVGIRTWA